MVSIQYTCQTRRKRRSWHFPQMPPVRAVLRTRRKYTQNKTMASGSALSMESFSGFFSVQLQCQLWVVIDWFFFLLILSTFFLVAAVSLNTEDNGFLGIKNNNNTDLIYEVWDSLTLFFRMSLSQQFSAVSSFSKRN